MEDPLYALEYYTTVFTGLLLLMNLCLLVSLRVALRWARRASESDTTEQGMQQWKAARRTIALMIGMVIVMNGLSVFANHQLRKSVFDFAKSPGVAQSHP